MVRTGAGDVGVRVGEGAAAVADARERGGMVWRCPGCGGAVGPSSEVVGAAVMCGCGGGGGWEPFADFVGGDRAGAERILGWSAEFVERVLPEATKLMDGGAVLDEVMAALLAAGMVDDGGRLTRLGGNVVYSLHEYQWQSAEGGESRTDEQFERLMDAAGAGEGSRVLDVGCGAGQTLRLLGRRRPGALMGVDMDAESLALGWRLSAGEGSPLRLARASGHALPLGDGSVTHVICRVALNYMHQATALREMVRVLQPGGWLLLRVEGPWFDVARVVGPRTAAQTVCRARDLGWGVVHAVSGWQPAPGTRVTGGRAFASVGRLRRTLGRLGCAVERVEESTRCPRFAGRATQWTVLARRAG